MGEVQTVLGPVPASDLGATLVHEHLFMGWPGWDLDPLTDDVRETQYAEVVERLRAARRAGVGTLLDATPADLGRSVALLQRISRDSGVHVVAATGIYHEAWGFPVYLRMRSTDELAAIFRHELGSSVDRLPVRAGAIKVASAGAIIGKHERRALLAAAAASQSSGAPVITHSANAVVGLDQATTLLAAGARPHKIQIGHCDAYQPADLRTIAALGVFVAFDQIVYPAKIDLAGRVASIASLVADGLAGQITLSQDQIGILGGRQVPLTSVSRSFAYLHQTLLPALRNQGVAGGAIERMLVENPARLLSS